MEEQILKMIEKNVMGYQSVNDDDPILIGGTAIAAKEITAHIIEFIEWIGSTNRMTTEELYKYWLTNIKEK